MTLWELFHKGGPVMWPLLACSITALAIIIERSFALRRSKIIPKVFIDEVERLARMGRFGDIERIARRNSSPMSSVIMAAIKNIGMRKELIKNSMEEAGASEAYSIMKNIDILGVITTISPLLGLLGSVSGMITSFHSIGKAEGPMSMALAAGISEALITTATGLSIAIPTFVFYRYFVARSEYFLMEMEKASVRILENIKGDQDEVQAQQG
jgi:biopolymer transport protein ExbB